MDRGRPTGDAKALPAIPLIRADWRKKNGDTRLGGVVRWQRWDRGQICCRQPMVLLLQLDSRDFPGAPLEGEALVYLFLCRHCQHVVALSEDRREP